MEATNSPNLKVIKEEKIFNFCKSFSLYYVYILLEIIMIILYALFTTYGEETNPKNQNTDSHTQEKTNKLYPFYQDVHVMIFIGFGFLMTFLKKYSWSAVGKNFVLSAWAIQIAILSIGFWKSVVTSDWSNKIEITIHNLIDADFAAGSVLIAFGAVLGKLHFTQYLFMATIQTIIYGLQFNVGYTNFAISDIGGSITIHMFGAYFGLTVAMMTKRKDADKNPNNASNYISNLIAMVGTLFLWMYWPSFNGALSSGNAQQRIIINTLLSLCGSCVMVFLLTPFFREGKIHMENVLNATLAGGVIIGATADMIIYPYVAFIIGCGAGTISLIGFEVIGPFLNRTIGLQDTCGVHSLHGIPGLLGGIISAIISGTATKENYGETLEFLFPEVAKGRTCSVQGGYQLAAIAVSLSLAIVSGIITGLVLNLPIFERIESLFDDGVKWVIEEDDENFSLVENKKKSVEMLKMNTYLGTESNIETVRGRVETIQTL